MKPCKEFTFFAITITLVLLISAGSAAAKPCLVHQEESPIQNVLISTMLTPEAVEINEGETVNWVNYQRPKGPVVVTSETGLWEKKTLYYGQSFSYKFETPGTYAIKVDGKTAIENTIIVKETNSKSTAQKDPKTMPETPVQEINSPAPNLQDENTSPISRGNKAADLVIYGSILPEKIEIKTGETVHWKNYHRPKGPIGLISDNGLWEKIAIPYGKSFSYTFKTPGTYTFGIEGNSEIKNTVIVN